MITPKRFFWYSVAAGLVIGLIGSQINTFRAAFWLDNIGSPLMSHLRSRDCGRLDPLLQLECQRAHARALNPAVVAAAVAIEREQTLMQIAIRAASLPRPGLVTYYTLATGGQQPRRDWRMAEADIYFISPRHAASNEEGEGEDGSPLRMTRMAPVAPID